MRLTKFNSETGEYECATKAKTLAEFRAQRKAVIQRLGELEDKSTDLAEEIFAEIDRMIYKVLNDRHYIMGDMCYEVAELKKKYIGKDTNVTTKTEEGK